MKKVLLTLIIFIGLSYFIKAQTSHLSVVHDIEGTDTEYYVRGMVGTNDSLYVLCNTPDWRGKFYRIDENGNGYKEIAQFDGDDYGVASIIGNDTAIYITTYNTPALYKYSLKDYSFKLIKKFDFMEVSAIQIKYITDSVLWFLSGDLSAAGYGSIFTTNHDGTNLKKIYKPTSPEQPGYPIDFLFHENKIYISCWSGGDLIPDGGGTFTYAGAVIRINNDGTGFQNIIPGSIQRGTNPMSVVIRENKLFGVFAFSQTQYLGAQFFSCNLDGTAYDSLGGLPQRAINRMLSTDSLIYAFTQLSVVGINPTTNDIRIYDDLLSNPDFGHDVVSDPAFLNGIVFFATQQGGPNGGGSILKWQNEPPELDDSYVQTINGRLRSIKADIDLNSLFTDAEGDSLTFSWTYDEQSVSVSESDGVLELSALIEYQVQVNVIVTDGWAGYKSAVIILNTDGTLTITNIDKQESVFFIYPNPTSSILKLSSSNVKSIDVLGVDGKIQATFPNPKEEIDISSLRNGTYFVRSYTNGKVAVQRIVKN